MSGFRSGRVAFTLVELLVVIALIGTLMALLAPALGRARERGRLTTCLNNEYQLAFGLNRYDEQNNVIPGWYQQLQTSSTATKKASSWSVCLLPFLERNDLYDMWLQPTGFPVPAPIVQVFQCPSAKVATAVSGSYGTISYAGNVGASGTNSADGVFLMLAGAVSPMSLTDVAEADGTAVTLAFSEKAARDVAPHGWAYPWCSGTLTSQSGLFGLGKDYPAVFGVSGAVTTSVVNDVNTHAYAPFSDHSDGVVVAYCDGHTGFLKSTVDPWVYGQLLTVKTRWRNNASVTNSPAMQPWLLKGGTSAYLLDERDLAK